MGFVDISTNAQVWEMLYAAAMAAKAKEQPTEEPKPSLPKAG